MELQGVRALVTGGAGTVGSTIVDHLVRAGVAEVVVLDTFGRGSAENLAWAMANGTVSVIDGDIRDRSVVAGAMEGIDLLSHQAALRITRCAEEPRLALEVMVDGTFNVLEAAVTAGVGRVVFASSASVYGMASVFPTPEHHHPYDNRTFYGAAKLFGETLIRSFNEMYGLDYVSLRYFNVYGPRMDIRSAHTEVLVRWMDRIESGVPPLILGDGELTTDFVYVDDVARANVLAAQSDATDVTVNVGTGTETSLKELAQTLLAVMGSDLGIEFGPERGVNPVARRSGDTSSAAKLLGFTAEVGLDDGLRLLVEWWKQQRAADRAADRAGNWAEPPETETGTVAGPTEGVSRT